MMRLAAVLVLHVRLHKYLILHVDIAEGALEFPVSVLAADVFQQFVPQFVRHLAVVEGTLEDVVVLDLMADGVHFQLRAG